MKILLAAISVVGLAAAAGACASASAKAPPPDMAIPPPPPRVIAINAEPIAEPVSDLPASPGSSTTPSGRGTTRGPRDGGSRPPATAENRADPKPDAKPPDTPPVPEPAPVTPPPGPAPQLRTTESDAAETAVHASLDRAKTLLNGVDYRRLNTPRRKAYDDAKRFMQQAEDALKAGNAVFAQGVAVKAETLARELAGK